MIEIPLLVTSTWTALQPFLPIIATKAAEEIGKTAIGKVWTAIEKKFETKPAAKEAMQDVLKNPQDADAHVVFRVQLKKLLEEDNTFASDLSKLLKSASSDYKAQLIGDGAIAQGDGATAFGKNGVHIGGKASNNVIIAGDNVSVNTDKKKKK